VLLIVISATIASFFINSIIDAIHIATFIASASYFFPLMGGLFWKRATKEGALAGMVVGAVAQTALVVIDLANTPLMAPPYLETIHPVLMGHGVIVGLSLGAVTFFGVSILSAPSGVVNLAPFFKDEAKKLELHGVEKIDESDPEYKGFLGKIEKKVTGERTHLHIDITVSKALDWNRTVETLKGSYPAWVTPAGVDSVYRLTHPDMLSCVSMTRGRGDNEIWIAAEPRVESAKAMERELFTAYGEVSSVLEQIGMGTGVIEPRS